MDNNTNDKLTALLRAHGVDNDVKTPDVVEPVVEEEPETEYVIDYGDNDADEEMRIEDEMHEAAIKSEIEKRKAEEAKNPKYFTPPNEKDMDYNAEAIGFQGDKLAIVTNMVNRVIAKYHIVSGNVPEMGPGGMTKMMVMGELVDVYHEFGEEIDGKFEQVLLSRWILPDGRRAIDAIDKTGKIDDGKVAPNETDDRPLATFDPVVININVEGDTPVTVNVDKDVVAEINESNRVDINVIHVTKSEMKKRTIVYNSDMKGVIKPFDSGINDVPITLPLSGYRCTMKGVSWFDFIKLSTAPTSGNSADVELKKWSIIYKHMKNVSIGEFENFEDFMKKTKFKDREILMWALLCASSKTEEEMSLTCGNPDCKGKILRKYSPRELIHVDFEKVPDYYQSAYKASVGPDAVEVWRHANDEHECYQLPTTGIEVEFEQPSAWDYIYKIIPLMDSIYKRYTPEGMSVQNIQDDELAEANILAIMAMCISAIYVHDGQSDKTYCYTVWDKIEQIISECLDTDDSGILINLVQQINHDDNGISYFLPDVTCPTCGRHDEKVPIDDIAETMLFQLSRRLANTKLNLIRTATN